LTKVGCFNGKEKHQLAGAGPIHIVATSDEMAGDFTAKTFHR
jgi:hypothetical protein